MIKTNTTQIIAQQNARNYGVEILRVLLCAAVISGHYVLDAFIGKAVCNTHVAIFFMLAFMFSAKVFANGFSAVKKRFMRLFVPYISFPFIYIYIYIIVEKTLKIDSPIGHNLMLLFWQVHTGHASGFAPQLWFLWVQMVLLVFFALVYNFLLFISKKIDTSSKDALFKRLYLIALVLLFVFAFFMQYSGLNARLFGSLPYELKYPLGRICEMLPYAVVGILLAKYNVLERAKNSKYRLAIFALCTILYAVLYFYPHLLNPLLPSQDVFFYAGFALMIRAILLLFVFYLLPIDMILCRQNAFCRFAQVCVRYGTRYTLGIYCVHMLVGYYVDKFLVHFNLTSQSYVHLFIIYAICYAFCAIVDALPFKICHKLVN